LIARPGEQNYGMAMAVSATLIVFVWLVIALLDGLARSLSRDTALWKHAGNL
jgi:hypothetical protein